MAFDRDFREAALALADAVDDLLETWHGGDVEAALDIVQASLRHFDGVWEAVQDRFARRPLEPFSRPYEERKFGNLFVLRWRLARQLLACGHQSPLTLALALASACAEARSNRVSPVDDPVAMILAAKLVALVEHDSRPSAPATHRA